MNLMFYVTINFSFANPFNYTLALKKRGLYCFSSAVLPSILPCLTNILCHTFLTPCITATSKFLTEFRSASYLLPVLQLGLFSDILSVTNIFRHAFFNSHASQPLQTWYGALARGPTGCLPNSGQPVIYFLFYNLVYFLTFCL